MCSRDPACAGAEWALQGCWGSGPGPGRRAVVRLVRGCESWAADAAERAIRVDAARVDAELGGRLGLVTLVDVWGGGRYQERCSELGTQEPTSLAPEAPGAEGCGC